MRFPNRSGLLLWLLITPSAWAQDTAGAQKALAKAQFMLRQASSEKVQLQQEVESLRQQLDVVQKQLANNAAVAADRQKALENKFNESDGQWRSRHEKNEQELHVLRERLRLQTGQGEKLAEQLRRQTENFDLCYSNNKKLYSMNLELLERYQNKGFMDVVRQKEPFTGQARVTVENLIQDYQYQLEDLTIGANAGSVSAGQKAGP